MTHTLRYLLILFAAVALASCSHNDGRQRLQAEIEASNRQCPISLGANGALTAVTYDSNLNVVTMHYRMNRYYMNPEALAQSSPQQKREMAAYLREDDNRRLLDLFNDAGASLALSFIIGDATEPVVLTLSSNELRNIASDADHRTTLRQQLGRIAQTENALCPTDLGNGVTATAVLVDGKYLTYAVTVPDSVDLSTSASQARFRSALVAGIDSLKADPESAATLELLHNLEYGIRYSISADSLNFTIDITPEEI